MEDNISDFGQFCVSCKKVAGGAHKCRQCYRVCHAIPPCSWQEEDDEEGYGSRVLCSSCKNENDLLEEEAIPTESQPEIEHKNTNTNRKRKNAMSIMMEASQSQTLKPPKRYKSGHEKTTTAVCLLCYEQYKINGKKKFWFSRFNNSSKQDHMKVHDCSKEFISTEDPKAVEAKKTLREIDSRKKNESKNDGKSLKQTKTINSMKEIKSNAQKFHSDENPRKSAVNEHENNDIIQEDHSPPHSPLVNLNNNPTASNVNISGSQLSIEQFFDSPFSAEKQTVVDVIVNKISKRISSLTIDSKKHSTSLPTSNDLKARESTNAKHLDELLEMEADFEIIGENDIWVLRCKSCYAYLNNPISSSKDIHKPSSNSLATGMQISKYEYKKFKNGNCPEYRRLKHRVIKHMEGSSKTHFHSAQFMKEKLRIESRQQVAIRNQLRTAIGVVQSKCAAQHYETRIAELFQAGADVGDFSHSRALFPQMLEVACHYVDKETKTFLNTKLKSTGLPPHFYVTTDKSTNHRVQNQATMICPTIMGERKAIPVSMKPVYATSDVVGGKGEELAYQIFEDLRSNLDISETKLLQMQGKVTDGQYINNPFVSTMNEPIFNLLKQLSSHKDQKVLLDNQWWECHWDPAHWLDKVFSKLNTEKFVTRLLARVSQFHQTFGYGKMHIAAKETAKELNLPFRVTNSFAPQRFMSSSYLSLKRLEYSYEAYVEAFLDHDNEEEKRYKLCGSDFVFDLCGLLDLLWPIVILMLKAQLQWCPGWKFTSYIDKVIAQLNNFIEEITDDVPSKKSSPRLNEHIEDIINFKFKSVQLELGWLIVGQLENGGDDWLAREIPQCRNDLKNFAMLIKDELENRFESCFPKINRQLNKCLDFGVLFNEICGERNNDDSHQVNKSQFAKFGAVEFKRCVKFVSLLPHVKELNLAMCSELSGSILWRMKETLINVIWGDLLIPLFCKFFKGYDKNQKKSIDINIKEGVYIVSFEIYENETEFLLTEQYRVKFSNGTEKIVFLQEQEVIKSLYNDPIFYTSVGQEFCIVYDIMYAKTGTESVVESFYGVVQNQEMDGGQSLKVLANRSKVDWCFPNILNCERALNEMSKLYINGDEKLGVKRHYVPVYSSKTSGKNRDLSKVLKRLKNSNTGLSFLI